MADLDERKACFVIAPIGEDESETRKRSDLVLRHIIRPAVEACGYVATRADEMDRPGLITSQVIQRVIGDPLVVADLTEMNPNVFYELAIRHAIRRPFVQIIEKKQRIPFDVAGTRTIQFDHHDLDSVENAKAEIAAQIRALEENPDDIETPIAMSVDLQKLRLSENPQDRSLAELIDEIADMRMAVSKLSEAGGGDVSEELVRLRRSIERGAQEPFPGSRFHTRRLERYLHPHLVEMAFSPDRSARAVAYASIAAVARNRIPWLYEAASEVFRQLAFAGETKARSTEQAFAMLARNALDMDFGHETGEGDPLAHGVLELTREIVFRRERTRR